MTGSEFMKANKIRIRMGSRLQGKLRSLCENYSQKRLICRDKSGNYKIKVIQTQQEHESPSSELTSLLR